MIFFWTSTGLYIVFLLILTIIFNRIPSFQLRRHPSSHAFSIVVPFRNEQENLPRLIEHLNRLKYSPQHFEVIFVNDQSGDSSVEIITRTEINFPHRLLHSPGQSTSPKKETLQTGINHAQFPYIITLDADAFPDENWLTAYNDFLIENPGTKMIIGPVLISASKRCLEKLQQTEMFYLQGLTAVSAHLGYPLLANGANLLFDKKSFKQTQAYAMHMNYAGGDDIFLLQIFSKQFKGQIRYLKSLEAIITTKAHSNFRAWKHQHLRWAKKMFLSANIFTWIFLFWISAVYLTGILTLLNFQLAGFLSWFFILWMAHYLYFRTISRFFNSHAGYSDILLPLIISPVFYFYLILMIIFNRKFEWKNRTFKK